LRRRTPGVTRLTREGFLRARAYIFVGQRESAQIIRSAHTLNRLLPESTLEILPGFHHGEFSICHAQEYAHRIIQMLDNRL